MSALWVPPGNVTEVESRESFDIRDRVRFGDPTAGWRGEPNARVYWIDGEDRIEVWTEDQTGERYCMASIYPELYPNEWREQLLRNLKDGDWQRGFDAIAKRALEANQKLEADKAYQEDQKTGEVAEKLAWAVRRDIGSETTGIGKDFY